MIKTTPKQPLADIEEELQLIERIIQRDEIALERLYVVYTQRLNRFLFRMVGYNESGVSEIINEVMFIVWQKADTFDRTSKVSTWIFGIAVRIARKFLSRRGIDTYDSSDIAEEQQDLSWQQDLERKDSLEKAMAKLSPEHRAVVELTYYQGLHYHEVAAIMDCPENTIKTRMFYAREKLRQALERAQDI
jgi:RNA polymerase sigma factor (sigma-70 family)